MKSKLYLILLSLIIQSCAFIRMDDSLDLGGNYRYIQEYPQSIIYHKSSSYDGIGIIAIPNDILSYSYNDNYIIAKTQEVDMNSGRKVENSIQYWIINKSLKEAEVKPLNKMEFESEMSELKIKIKLKN